jgi:hypothetical protein
MKVYHGSDTQIEEIDLEKCKYCLKLSVEMPAPHRLISRTWILTAPELQTALLTCSLSSIGVVRSTQVTSLTSSTSLMALGTTAIRCLPTMHGVSGVYRQFVY